MNDQEFKAMEQDLSDRFTIFGDQVVVVGGSLHSGFMVYGPFRNEEQAATAIKEYGLKPERFTTMNLIEGTMLHLA